MNTHGFTESEFKEITKAALFFSNRCEIRVIDRESAEFAILAGLVGTGVKKPLAFVSIDSRNENIVMKVGDNFIVYFFEDSHTCRTLPFPYLDEAIFHAVRTREDTLYSRFKMEGGINDSVFTSSDKTPRISVARNPYQGNAQRVLCVCSAGILRSPTIAEVLRDEYGFNCRVAGAEDRYALIKVDDVLMIWAEHIVCATPEIAKRLEKRFPNHKEKIVAFNIPDQFGFRNPTLVEMIKNDARNFFGLTNEPKSV